jgi:hypothetical protein
VIGHVEFPREDLTAQERAALITDLLRQGKKLKTAEVAVLMGIGPGGASRLMHTISRVVPVALVDHEWQLVQSSPLHVVSAVAEEPDPAVITCVIIPSDEP